MLQIEQLQRRPLRKPSLNRTRKRTAPQWQAPFSSKTSLSMETSSHLLARAHQNHRSGQ
jgi:hypothetical protein